MAEAKLIKDVDCGSLKDFFCKDTEPIIMKSGTNVNITKSHNKEYEWVMWCYGGLMALPSGYIDNNTINVLCHETPTK